MRLVRTLLVLSALGVLVLLVLLVRRGAARTPDSVLAQARALAEFEPPDFGAALATLEFGIEALEDEVPRERLAPLALEHMRLFRARWERSLTLRGVVHDPHDLERVLDEATAYLATYDAAHDEVLELGLVAALEAGRPEQALPLARRLAARAADPAARATAATLLGHTHEALADAALARYLAQRGDLAPGARDEEARRVRRLVARPAEDGARALLLEELRGALSEAHATAAAEALEQAGAELSAARASFLEALAEAPDPRPVVGLQDLFLRAGEHAAAADLGRAALARADLADDPRIFVRTIDALRALGHLTSARTWILERLQDRRHPFDYDVLDRAELERWTQVTFELESWDAFDRVALLLRTRNRNQDVDREQADLGHFYALVARTQVRRFGAVSGSLGHARLHGTENYPGQMLDYWNAAEILAEEEGDVPRRRRALLKGTEVAPLEPPLARQRASAGRMWRTLGGLYLEESDWLHAERALSHALRLLPGERAELEPRWREAGRRAMERRGRSEAEVRAAPLVERGRGTYPPMGPYEACLRVEAALARGQTGGVRVLLGPVLEAYPGLPPALEASARGYLAVGHVEPAVEAALTLLEEDGTAELARSLLRRVPVARMSGDQIRRLVLADPEHAGLRALLARRLACDPPLDPHPLLGALSAAGEAPGLLLLGAEAWLVAGDAERALAWFERVPLSAPARTEAGALGLRCAAAAARASARPELVQRVVDGLLDQPALAAESLTPGLDALIAAGFGSEAERLLRALDARGARLAPEQLLRGALAASARSADAATGEWLDRAHPYLPPGWTELAELLLTLAGDAPEAERTPSVVAHARGLLATSLAHTPLERALLQALAGESAAARAALELPELADDPRVPTARRLLTAGDGTPSAAPELALGWLLASGWRPFAPWTLAQLRDLPEEQARGELAAVLAAHAWQRLGHEEEARAVLAPWAGDAHALGEAARLHARLTLPRPGETRARAGGRHDGADDVERLLLLLQEDGTSATSGGALAADAEARRLGAMLARARELAARGDAALAREHLEDALAERPGAAVLELALARSLLAAGHTVEALDRYDQVLAARPRVGALLLGELLPLLAPGAGRLPAAAAWAELDALEARYPSDPRLPIALVRTRLAAAPGAGAWARARAADHLTRFRERTAPRSVESLHPGAAELWLAFLVERDPQAAVGFALAELNARPEDLGLWDLWCRALVEGQRPQEALAVHRSLHAISAQPALDANYARLLLDLDLPLPDTLQARLDARPELDPALELRRLLREHAQASDGAARARLRERALALWDARAENGLAPGPAARWLLLGLGAGDARVLEVLRSAAGAETGATQRTLLQALAHLAAPPPAAGEPGETG